MPVATATPTALAASTALAAPTALAASTALAAPTALAASTALAGAAARRSAVAAPLIAIALFTALSGCGPPATPPSAPAPPAPSAAAPAASVSAASPSRRVRLVGIDVQGTSDELVSELLRRHSSRIAAFVDALYAEDEASSQAAKRELLAELGRLGDFAFVDLSVFEELSAGEHQVHVVVELVEERDRARRMPFLASPQRQLPDPGGLLAVWDRFFQIGLQLLIEGKLGAERVACPAFHCLFDARLPELAPLQQRLLAEVPAARAALVETLRQARDPEVRASAAFVLAYQRDGAQLVADLTPSIFDPSEEVRNNVLRVLAEVANYHPEVAVPMAPLIAALDFPAASDRNKASLVLVGLAEHHPELRDAIAAGAGALLLTMLRTQAPQTHAPAFLLLKTLSGQTFGPRDYRAWQAWLARR
jgi:hypothetical protein